MPFSKINLHIHSIYSDGKNSIQQIVRRALQLKFDYIAITDHFTDSWKAWVSKLNNYETINEYLEELTKWQLFLSQNKKKMILFKGLEVDLSSSEQFIKRYVQIEKYDFILFEYLQSFESIAFAKKVINYWQNSMKNNEKFPIIGLAHFDPSYFIRGGLDLLITFLKQYNIYFEFNPSYATYYSRQNELFFRKLEEDDIPVGIGCDSHNLPNLSDLEEPIEMIKYYNLEQNYNNLIHKLELKSINR